MKLYFISLLVTIGLISCNRPLSKVQHGEKSEKEAIADNVIGKVAYQLKTEKGLRPCGTIGQMLNEIQVLGLAFYYFQPVDIVEGRRLLVQAVDAMLKEVNRETRIHPYLSRYPFRPWNVQVQIFLRSPDGGDVSPGNLCVIDASEGNLVYEIKHPVTKMLLTVYRETYEEAVARLADPSLPLVSFQLDSEISQEQLIKLRKGISFASDDGAIWHLDENGCWAKDPRSEK